MPARLPLDANHIIELYRRGISPEQMSQQLGVAPATIRKRLIEAGVAQPRGILRRAKVDRDEVLRLYRSGMSGHDVAVALGASVKAVYRVLGEASDLRVRKIDLDVEAIVQRYQAGEAPEDIAADLDVSATPILARLREAGLQIRGRGEAMKLRMAQLDEQGRRDLVRKANATVRGKPLSDRTARNIALARERNPWDWLRGPQEQLLEDMLRARGIEATPQKAIGRYNADLAAGTVAMEVFGGGWHHYGQHAARAERRYRHILDAGWHVLVIDLMNHRRGIADAAADYAVAFIQEAERNPSALREYRMIRGSGEFVAGRRADADDLASVFPARLGHDRAICPYKC